MRSFIIAYLPAQLAPDHRSKKVAKLAGYENRSLRVCDMSEDTKLDLRTSISLTPNMQVTPKALAALAHSGKSPAAGPLTTCEDLRIHTYSVIAHADSEIGVAKGDLALDVARLCMLVRIADRTPPSPATRLTAYSLRLF
jgi:hypothetical protein